MPDSTRGSIYISTADEIGETLVEKLGGSGYTPNEWDKSINLCGISDADIPTALENIENSADGTERGSFEITKANAIASVLNKKFKTTRGFKPKEWASAVDKLTALQIKNASGAIASFKDGADDVPIASASFSIVPYQNLNGYSKPWASGCGKNMIDITSLVDGYVNANGTMNSNHPMGEMHSGFIKVKPNTSYYFSIVETTGTAEAWVGIGQYTNEDVTTFIKRSSYWSFTTESNCEYIIVSARNLATATKIQLEEGSSATAWEPYSNVCPITPYSQMTITHARKNLIKSEKYQASQTILTLGQSDNSSFGTFLKAGTYTISYTTSGDTCYIYRREQNDSSNTNMGKGSSKSFTIDKDGYFRFWLFGDGAISENISNVMLEVGSSQTTFSPYSPPEVIGDNFGRSVYGGSRASDGTLTETEARKKIRDFGNWIYVSSYTGYFQVQFDEMKAPVDNYTALVGLLCEVFKTDSGTNAGSGNVNYTIAGVLSGGSVFLRIKNNDYNDVTQFLNDFGDYYVVYPLADPVDHALDPLPEINSYYGDNNIYTDIVDGESSVNYRADIDLSQ